MAKSAHGSCQDLTKKTIEENDKNENGKKEKKRWICFSCFCVC